MPRTKTIKLDDAIVRHLKHIRDDFGQEYAFPVVFEAELGAPKADVAAALARLCRSGRIKEAVDSFSDLPSTDSKCYGLPGAGAPSLFSKRR